MLMDTREAAQKKIFKEKKKKEKSLWLSHLWIVVIVVSFCYF